MTRSLPRDPSALKSSTRLAVAVAAWSLSPFLIYESRGIAEAPVLALFAVAIGAILTALVVSVSGAAPIEMVRAMPNPRAWFGEAAVLGLGAFVAYPLLYFSAIQHGPPAAVNLVNYLWPVVAVVVVSTVRASGRSLETALAAGFGFAGAGLAISAGTGVDLGQSGEELGPFVLAALGALVYGGISGAISLRHPVRREDSLALFTAALLLAGVISLVLIGALAVVHSNLVQLELGGSRLWALVAYAALLPVAHLSWMTAVRDPRVPAFSAAFLVPVISTGVLTFAFTGVAKPEILSALVLVLCGIIFANVRERGVPVGYAVGLAFLSSIQVSQILAVEVPGKASDVTGTLSQLLAAVTAIFAGFILSNAIQRNGALHTACSRFYAKAATLSRGASWDLVVGELDMLDCTVIHGIDDFAPVPEPTPVRLEGEFASEWADVDVAISNGVSSYEWLVLLVGGGSLIFALHAYAVASHSAVTVVLRALGVALVVGILFTIRDYDRYRPKRLCELLVSFRARYGFPTDSDSPLSLGGSYWSQRNPATIRFGLACLVGVAIVAITLNG